MLVAGDDLACEVVARALAAAGVGRLVLLRRTGPLAPPVAAALTSSNPRVRIETRPWPTAGGWLAALAGATVVVRSGFDDDPLLRAAIRMGLPVVVMRGREDRMEVLSFRRHGPCPHAPLDVPEKTSGTPAEDGAGAVVAAHLAAAEVLVVLSGATTGAASARHITIGGDSIGDIVARAVDIPWAPECFACGGGGMEMSLS